MTFGEIMTYIMLVFAILGCIDKAIGSKLKIGDAFERAVMSTGALILAMVGPMAAAPLISDLLTPIMSPICEFLGIDPSVTAGLIAASDAGGWSLAVNLAKNETLGKFSGAVLASTIGCTIAGTFPMCFMLAPKEKIPLVAKGLTIGFISIPVGCFVGGIAMGLNLGVLLLNMLPTIIISALFVFGLTRFEKVTIKIVTVFGYVMTAFVILALGTVMAFKVFNVNSDKFETFDSCLSIVGGIMIFLCGAFVLLEIVQKLFKKQLQKLGEKMGLDDSTLLGVITTSVNAIPMFPMLKKMNDRGVIINIAFTVCAAYVFGDHLAFQTTVDTSMAVPLVLTKLVGGVFAIVLAVIMTKPKQNKEEV